MSATPPPKLEHFLQAACQHFGVGDVEVCGHNRQPPVLAARDAFCVAAYRTSRWSMEEIGGMLGRTTHHTAGHAVRKSKHDPEMIVHAELVTQRAYEIASRMAPEPTREMQMESIGVALNNQWRVLRAIQESQRRIEERLDAAHAAH